MRIKEYAIIRYGPISNPKPTSLSNFTLLFGNNEEGKSLTIDAVVKMLFRRKSDLKEFEELDRVEETPEGYLIIEDKDGREVKLPEEGDISEIAKLSPSDCSNLFIIRNSNLSISRDSEPNYYKTVTDKLTGLKTKEIAKIKKKLQEFGRLTNPDSKSTMSDSSAYGKILSRIKRGEGLIKEINDLQKKLKEENYDKIEEEIALLNEKLNSIKEKISLLEQAEKRLKYEKASQALAELKKALETINKLSNFKEEDEQRWREAERDLKRNREEKEKLISDIEEKESELKRKKEEARKLKRMFNFLQKDKKEIEDEIKLDVKAHESLLKSTSFVESLWKSIKTPAYVLTGVVPLLFIGAGITSFNIFKILSVIFFIFTLSLWTAGIACWYKKAKTNSDFEKIKLKASKYGLNSDGIEDLKKSIADFEKKYETKVGEINQISQEISILENEIKKIKEKQVPEIEKNISECEEAIEKIKLQVSVKSIEQYKEKLHQKHEAKSKMNAQAAVLKNYFGGKDVEENISKWEKEVNRLKVYKNKSTDIEFDEESLNNLKTEKEALERKKAKLQELKEKYKEKLRDVENKSNEILKIEEDRLLCSTYKDLELVKSRLDSFITENKENTRKVLEVIKIFEEIEKDEEEKVKDLFGEESLVSSYFSGITGNRYKYVDFLPEKGKIVVTKSNGEELDAKKLSGGAYDQLYFSIRLALGDKLMKGEKGFFIMDDPFIKADKIRLKHQMKVLKNICEMGWQILYFSAKDEVKECLENEIKKGNVQLIEIKAVRK